MSTANSSYDSSYDSSQTFPLSFPLKVLLLGSGELGKELTISLQRLGVEVVAVDSYVAAPAMQVATQSRVVDMTDAQALRELITQVAPDLIVPEVEKLAASALVEAAAAGIRVVPTAKVVELTFDRQGIRTLAAQHAGVPTSPYAFADSFDALCLAAQEVGFPCFVKPTMSSSGHGQSRVTSPQGLRAAWEEASDGARADTGRVIVEGQIDFDYEITLLTVRHLDPADPTLVCTSFCAPIGHRQEHGDYVESWQPQAMPQATLEKAQATAKAVTDALAEVSAATEPYPMLGIFGVELFIQGDQVYFSELSPRPHDTGMVTMLTQRQSEFDLHARAILGLPLDPAMDPGIAAGASVPFKSGIESENPRFEGIAQVLGGGARVEDIASGSGEGSGSGSGTVRGEDGGAGGAIELRIFGKPVAHPGRRMAVVLASGTDADQARRRGKAALDSLKII